MFEACTIQIVHTNVVHACVSMFYLHKASWGDNNGSPSHWFPSIRTLLQYCPVSTAGIYAQYIMSSQFGLYSVLLNNINDNYILYIDVYYKCVL